MATTLKAHLKTWRHSRFRPARLVYHACRWAWFGCRLLMNPRLRSETLGQWRHRGFYHQRVTTTAANRYPVLFEQCRLRLVSRPRPRLLSFGCSTGEEVFTLAEYLPQAVIVGVDINEWCLAECRRKDPKQRHAFLHRRSAEFEREQDFDAIFCMAVFQYSANRSSPDNRVALGHTFEQFERETTLLDAKLKLGGLFIISHADFRFTDTTCAANYTPLNFPQNLRLRDRPIYGRDNRKLADQHESNRIFVKCR